MILRQVVGVEEHPAYQQLLAANLQRQYDFLSSVIDVSLAVNYRWLSREIILALHHHAVACLDVPAGRYRTGAVTVNGFHPPESSHVPGLMGQFIDTVNRHWRLQDPFTLPAFCLWQLNAIHPFTNGNGRTARALCHYVFCIDVGVQPPFSLPQVIRANRGDYVERLKECDSEGSPRALREFLVELISAHVEDS